MTIIAFPDIWSPEDMCIRIHGSGQIIVSQKHLLRFRYYGEAFTIHEKILKEVQKNLKNLRHEVEYVVEAESTDT